MIKLNPIKEYLKTLKTNYFICDIKYTKKESTCLDNLKIVKAKTFNYYGNIENLDDKKLNEFIKNFTLCKEDSAEVIIFNNIVHKLSNKICKAYNTKHCWITIRATLPNSTFDTPRWHKDGIYFFNEDNFNEDTPLISLKKNSKIQSKFITVLKGPGTLFIKNSKKINDIYEEYRNKRRKLSPTQFKNIKLENEHRTELANALKDIHDLNQLEKNKGLIFLAGGKDALLHSEPKMDMPRIFISILPGTEEEIAGLKRRRI